MAIWLIRASSHSEYEQKFIQLPPQIGTGKIDLRGTQGDQESA